MKAFSSVITLFGFANTSQFLLQVLDFAQILGGYLCKALNLPPQDGDMRYLADVCIPEVCQGVPRKCYNGLEMYERYDQM